MPENIRPSLTEQPRAARRHVTVQALKGKRVLGQARSHTLFTDRPVADGGTDIGCTSGELLLLAIGSCATGAMRNYLQRNALPLAVPGVEVAYRADPQGPRDAIELRLCFTHPVDPALAARLCAAAVSGGVTSRIHAGAPIDVRVQAPDSPSHPVSTLEHTAR